MYSCKTLNLLHSFVVRQPKEGEDLSVLLCSRVSAWGGASAKTPWKHLNDWVLLCRSLNHQTGLLRARRHSELVRSHVSLLFSLNSAALTFRIHNGASLSVCWTGKLSVNEQSQRTWMLIQPGLIYKRGQTARTKTTLWWQLDDSIYNPKKQWQKNLITTAGSKIYLISLKLKYRLGRNKLNHRH